MGRNLLLAIGIGLCICSCEKEQTAVPAPPVQTTPPKAAPPAPENQALSSGSAELTLEDALKSGVLQTDSTETSPSSAQPDSPSSSAAVAENPAPKFGTIPEQAPVVETPRQAPAATKTEITELSPKKAPALSPSSKGNFVVQVKASTDQSEIKRDAAKLAKSGIKTYTVTLSNGGAPIYRLRIGSFASPADARQYGHQRLIPLGYSFWVDQKSNENKGNP